MNSNIGLNWLGTTKYKLDFTNFQLLSYFAELDPSSLTFTSKQPPKKKRKSRTAFTNHQIFELEKRFLYQKYLSPADRDEIAAQLGLSNAQVSYFLLLMSKIEYEFDSEFPNSNLNKEIWYFALFFKIIKMQINHMPLKINSSKS